jgi:hypothetical protein
MQARVVDGEKLACHIGERHGFTRHLDLANGARWHFGQFCGTYKRHIRSLRYEKRDARTLSELSLQAAEYNFHAMARQNNPGAGITSQWPAR